MNDVIRTSKESDGWDVVGEYADTVAAMVATENELRAEIAELREQLRTAIPAIATLKQTRDELEAEIERLRAFLTEIATLPGQHHAGMITACDIAKHALGDNPTPHETCEQRYLKALQQIIMLSHEFNKERNAYAVKLEEIAHEAVTNAPNLNAECSACGARYEAIKGHRCTVNALKACEGQT